MRLFNSKEYRWDCLILKNILILKVPGLSKQCKPTSDAAECSIWCWFALFAQAWSECRCWFALFAQAWSECRCWFALFAQAWSECRCWFAVCSGLIGMQMLICTVCSGLIRMQMLICTVCSGLIKMQHATHLSVFRHINRYLSTLLKSYLDDGRVIMKGSVQWNAVVVRWSQPPAGC